MFPLSDTSPLSGGKKRVKFPWTGNNFYGLALLLCKYSMNMDRMVCFHESGQCVTKRILWRIKGYWKLDHQGIFFFYCKHLTQLKCKAEEFGPPSLSPFHQEWVKSFTRSHGVVKGIRCHACKKTFGEIIFI